jgi:RNA polymerase subunit RPABC4/transcription elongation factor Spt4
LLEDFVQEFISAVGMDPTIRPLPNLPSDSMEPSQITVYLTNPVGYSIMIVIGYRLKDSTLPFTELANVTMTPTESNKAVVLDLSKLSKGQYEIRVWVKDPVEQSSILNEYPLYLTLTDEKGGNDGPGIVIGIVILLLIIVIIAVIVFIYLQTRKKEEQEEVREEFECPECHNTVGVDDSVCPNCGAEFEEEAYKCPKCGHMLEPEDDTCGECGYDFSEQDKMEIDSEDYEVDEEGEEEEEIEDLVEMEE